MHAVIGTRHHVEISGTPIPGVKIDGHQLLATEVDLHADALSLPRIIIRLDIIGPTVDVEATVFLDDESEEALRRLGWKPPGDGQ